MCKYCQTDLIRFFYEKESGNDHTPDRCRDVLVAKDKERNGSRTIICNAPIWKDGKYGNAKCQHHNYDVCVHVANATDITESTLKQLEEVNEKLESLKSVLRVIASGKAVDVESLAKDAVESIDEDRSVKFGDLRNQPTFTASKIDNKLVIDKE